MNNIVGSGAVFFGGLNVHSGHWNTEPSSWIQPYESNFFALKDPSIAFGSNGEVFYYILLGDVDKYVVDPNNRNFSQVKILANTALKFSCPVWDANTLSFSVESQLRNPATYLISQKITGPLVDKHKNFTLAFFQIFGNTPNRQEVGKSSRRWPPIICSYRDSVSRRHTKIFR